MSHIIKEINSNKKNNSTKKNNINNSTYKKKLYQNKRLFLLTRENGQNILKMF